MADGYVGVLLAAGEGLRYHAAAGSSTADGGHKLLAPLPDGRCVAQASAQALLCALPDTIAIVAEHPPALAALLSDLGCQIVHVPDTPRGMGISLATAAQYLMDSRILGKETDLLGCAVALADMPWLRANTLTDLLEHAAPDRIIVPVFNGRRGHPVVFGAQFLPELAELGGDTGARALLARHGVLEIECDDVGILRDVDVPADLTPSRESVR